MKPNKNLKIYYKPSLKRYGDIKKITKSTWPDGADDGASYGPESG